MKIGRHLAEIYGLECTEIGNWGCKRAYISCLFVAVGNVGSGYHLYHTPTPKGHVGKILGKSIDNCGIV